MRAAITIITGRLKSRNASLKPAPSPKCNGLKALWLFPPRAVTTAMSKAVPKLPPRKKSIELILIAEASIWLRTIRDTVAARGVFTNPNPAPSIPAKVAITKTEAPAYVERPSTAKSISGAPTQVGRRAPFRSVRRLGRKALAGEQEPHGYFHGQLAGKSVRTPGPRHEAHPCLRQAELGVLGGDYQITGQGQLEPASQGVASVSRGCIADRTASSSGCVATMTRTSIW